MSKDDREQSLSIDELLPPSAKRRVHERIALKIREFAGVPLDQPLNPWRLAPYVKLRVTNIREIHGLSPETRKSLLGDIGKNWSGGATRPLPDGSRLVFLNPNHTRERQAATLMEEICHVILGHSPTKLTMTEDTGQALHFRNFNENQEEVAYAVGAATLVPYFGLRHAVMAGLRADKIARKFVVSRDLAEYRIKVCSLWEEYKQKGKQIS
jgi:hypothetical protein